MDPRPDSDISDITPSDIERAKQALVWDGAWSNVVGVLTGGVLLVGFALALGAGPLLIGALAAVPFFAQLAQIPAIALIERVRRRRLIAVASVTLGRTLILAMAAIPFLGSRPLQLGVLLGGDVIVAILAAVAGCAWRRSSRRSSGWPPTARASGRISPPGTASRRSGPGGRGGPLRRWWRCGRP
jgi:predicted lysophospholipase L1 biosynthesis ABC-type transport system permease subunit